MITIVAQSPFEARGIGTCQGATPLKTALHITLNVKPHHVEMCFAVIKTDISTYNII